MNVTSSDKVRATKIIAKNELAIEKQFLIKNS